MCCSHNDSGKHFIYKITNCVNNKVYIGKTATTIEQRFREHVATSRCENQSHRPIYRAFNKYGVENFKIEKIEECPSDEIACEREIYWIDKLRSYVGWKDSNGYNSTLGGDGKSYLGLDENKVIDYYLEVKRMNIVASRFCTSERTVGRILDKHQIEKFKPTAGNEKTILMIKDGKIIKEFSSIVEGYEYFGKNKRCKTIEKVLNGIHKTAYGYTWKYKYPQNKHNKPIVMMKEGKVIKEFPSQVHANVYFGKNASSRSIGNVLNGRNKTAYGYEWRYAV